MEVMRSHTTFIALLLSSLVIVAAVFFPFNFCPPNSFHWLQPEPGIYFENSGIGYSKPFLNRISGVPLDSITIEIWLRERSGSRNWGPRQIVSIFDGHGSPSLILGEWAGRLFLYNRFENVPKNGWWWDQFSSPNRIALDVPHFVAITFREDTKKIYLDGQVLQRQTELRRETPRVALSGGITLGNGAKGRTGWWGEILGLALYEEAIPTKEIRNHEARVAQEGIRSLLSVPEIFALYTFKEGRGNRIENIAGNMGDIVLPQRFSALPITILQYPGGDQRYTSIGVRDLLQNILLFLPFGYFLAKAIQKNSRSGYRVIFFVCFLSGVLSLSIEWTQLLIPTRDASTMDIACNILGAFVGSTVSQWIACARRPHHLPAEEL